ncbi:hypothetical protein HGT70_04700 [Rosenbergiella collisarenosi]|uniref:hypothetical protein n=1 Tax=Rosenbergiella collisarenosi TaxID=1544695 RepID=UPI001BDACE21|nr:hypothetical protein [Rosenbergiella collisarenosi]MBT0720583.1 hypothetical protein [Rosenbergiella collisarenosi]
MKAESLFAAVIMGLIIIAILVCSAAAYRYKSAIDQKNEAVGQVALQGKVIQAQQVQQVLFNEQAKATSSDNQTVQVNSDNVVVKYRETLRFEKTCNYAVPTDISNGLFQYTNRLRSSAVPEATIQPNRSGTDTAAAAKLTYCQAVLWINPLLAAIEQANNQLSAIRQLQEQGKQ